MSSELADLPTRFSGTPNLDLGTRPGAGTPNHRVLGTKSCKTSACTSSRGQAHGGYYNIIVFGLLGEARGSVRACGRVGSRRQEAAVARKELPVTNFQKSLAFKPRQGRGAGGLAGLK